jgi:hypothetical protein
MVKEAFLIKGKSHCENENSNSTHGGVSLSSKCIKQFRKTNSVVKKKGPVINHS